MEKYSIPIRNVSLYSLLLLVHLACTFSVIILYNIKNSCFSLLNTNICIFPLF